MDAQGDITGQSSHLDGKHSFGDHFARTDTDNSDSLDENTLRDFAAEPTKPGAVKEDLAVKVYAVGAVDPEALIMALGERAAQAQAKLDRYERQANALADPDGADLGPSLTLAHDCRTNQ